MYQDVEYREQIRLNLLLVFLMQSYGNWVFEYIIYY